MLFISSAIVAQEPSPTFVTVPHVATSAVGEVRVVPDRATIFVGVESRAPTAAAASASNARQLRAVMEALRSLGITPAQMSTSEYSVYPEQVFEPDKGDRTARIVGYVVRNTLRVEVRQIEQIGALLDAALSKGANAINSLQFTSSNADSARREALSLAVSRAEADALAIARAGGGCLGEVIELTTQDGYRPIFMEKSLARGAAQDATPITPGELTVTVQVTGRWKLDRRPAQACPSRR
ncbi:MAG: SIMPL domain-containing protein [Anaerolineae bacterium]|nr:SIMPL domain-containing protein [Gemmatimonadaceae bacterium]